MNSKERVAATLRHEIPDQVPYGEFAIDYDTVERVLGRKTYLRNKAGVARAVWEGRYEEMAESVAEDHIALVEAIDQDIIPSHILLPVEIERAVIGRDNLNVSAGDAIPHSLEVVRGTKRWRDDILRPLKVRPAVEITGEKEVLGTCLGENPVSAGNCLLHSLKAVGA